MRSVILCEGSTDLTLIQYFLEKVNHWNYVSEKITLGQRFGRTKRLRVGEDILDIGATKGCGNIIACLSDIFDTMRNASNPMEGFDKIVIITDRDELESELEFVRKIEQLADDQSIACLNEVQNDKWVTLKFLNGRMQLVEVQLLLLIIPFEENGALETFLLDAVASMDEYDRVIIEQGNQFVDEVDTENRYLSRRRYRTKAKFDVYFSIRTALEQFEQRRSILRCVPWEDYEVIQQSFGKLKELHIEN